MFGCGPVGLLAIASAWRLGAGRVIAVDEVASRLEMARSQHAEPVDFSTEDPVAVISELTSGIGADRVIDAVGVDAYSRTGERHQDEITEAAGGGATTWGYGTAPSQAAQWAVESVAKAGSIGIIGVYPPTMRSWPIGAAMNKNLTVKIGNSRTADHPGAGGPGGQRRLRSGPADYPDRAGRRRAQGLPDIRFARARLGQGGARRVIGGRSGYPSATAQPWSSDSEVPRGSRTAPTHQGCTAPSPGSHRLSNRCVSATTDHKEIGKLYLVTTFAFFMVAGAMAMMMRAELARPGLQFLSTEEYNQLFTIHGTIMLLLYATPTVFAFANLIMPLQIGSPDVAFPRLNAFSYWLFLFGGLMVLSGFLTPGGAADFGWFAYTPLSSAVNSPSVGGDLWTMGLVVSGLGTILAAVNMITTIICLRAPGMTMFRMPIFTWNILFTSILVLLAFPILTAALLGLEADRQLGAPCSTRPTAGRSSGSTCSGSSAIPRFTSSRCRSSAS